MQDNPIQEVCQVMLKSRSGKLVGRNIAGNNDLDTATSAPSEHSLRAQGNFARV